MEIESKQQILERRKEIEQCAGAGNRCMELPQ